MCVCVCCGCRRLKEKEKKTSMCLLVCRGICLHLPAQITPHKHTPNTNTHTIHLDSKGEEVWIMLALRDGQANQIHLETIGEGVQKGKLQEGVKGREERGEESPP